MCEYYSHGGFFLVLILFMCRLKLPIKKIPGARTGIHAEKLLFCQLSNNYSADSNYETSRLASFLILDGQIMWSTIVLSAPMIFTSEFFF